MKKNLNIFCVLILFRNVSINLNDISQNIEVMQAYQNGVSFHEIRIFYVTFFKRIIKRKRKKNVNRSKFQLKQSSDSCINRERDVRYYKYYGRSKLTLGKHDTYS